MPQPPPMLASRQTERHQVPCPLPLWLWRRAGSPPTFDYPFLQRNTKFKEQASPNSSTRFSGIKLGCWLGQGRFQPLSAFLWHRARFPRPLATLPAVCWAKQPPEPPRLRGARVAEGRLQVLEAVYGPLEVSCSLSEQLIRLHYGDCWGPHTSPGLRGRLGSLLVSDFVAGSGAQWGIFFMGGGGVRGLSPHPPRVIALLWEGGEVCVERVLYLEPTGHHKHLPGSQIRSWGDGLGEAIWGSKQPMHFLRAFSFIEDWSGV